MGASFTEQKSDAGIRQSLPLENRRDLQEIVQGDAEVEPTMSALSSPSGPSIAMIREFHGDLSSDAP